MTLTTEKCRLALILAIFLMAPALRAADDTLIGNDPQPAAVPAQSAPVKPFQNSGSQAAAPNKKVHKNASHKKGAKPDKHKKHGKKKKQ